MKNIVTAFANWLAAAPGKGAPADQIDEYARMPHIDIVTGK